MELCGSTALGGVGSPVYTGESTDEGDCSSKVRASYEDPLESEEMIPQGSNGPVLQITLQRDDQTLACMGR